MKRNERRRMARQQSLPVEQQRTSTWWEGTEDMAPFPCSYDMSHEHTIHEHTLRATPCPIATFHIPQEEGWNDAGVGPLLPECAPSKESEGVASRASCS
jgi:hypothetical protein